MEKKEGEIKLNHIYCGNTVKVLKTFPDECINTIITSPPYWGLRDYGEDTNTIWGGDKNCEHIFQLQKSKKQCLTDAPEPSGLRTKLENLDNEGRGKKKLEWISGFCSKCGAWYGQLGLEPTLDLYLSHLWQITDELYRVLRKDGIMFWNHGDSYNSSPPGNKQGQMAKQLKDGDGVYGRLIKRYGGDEARFKRELKNYPTKCLCLQNYRLILGMVDIDYRILVEWRVIGKPENKLEYMLKHPKIQGILRNSIIWNKPNHMPSSVKDRFANSYEPVFMLVKQSNPQYYYNIKTGLMADRKAKEPKENIDWEWRPCPKCTNKEYFNVRVRDSRLNRFIEKATEKEIESIKKGECPRCKGTGKIKYSFWRALNYWFDLDAARVPHKSESLERVKGKWNGHREPMSSYQGMDIEKMCDPAGKNPGDFWTVPVDARKKSWASNAGHSYTHKRKYEIGKDGIDTWTIPTQAFPEAHFATFPEKLIQPMIFAGCPQWVCKKCGKARVRIVKTDNLSGIIEKDHISQSGAGGLRSRQSLRSLHRNISPNGKTKGVYYSGQTTGWTDCGCNAGWDAGIVLDPFMGAGTVGVVATKSGRDYVGIEIKREYCEMAEKRIKNITPSFL